MYVNISLLINTTGMTGGDWLIYVGLQVRDIRSTWDSMYYWWYVMMELGAYVRVQYHILLILNLTLMVCN